MSVCENAFVVVDVEALLKCVFLVQFLSSFE